LDLVVISHPHADHFAGLLEALDSLEVATLVDRTEIVPPAGGAAGGTRAAGAGNTGGEEAGRYLQLRGRLAAGGTRLLRASPGSSLAVDGVRVVFFAPPDPLVLLAGEHPWGDGRDPPSGDELNGGSLVALLDAGEAEVLLPGDAEADVLEDYELPPLDAIVVPHHGSRGAVSRSLLAAVQAKLALISVGKNNTFGHPERSTLAILAAARDTIVRTDECGWVSLLLNDAEMTISTERTRAP
jgi:competence protein ComEC